MLLSEDVAHQTLRRPTDPEAKRRREQPGLPVLHERFNLTIQTGRVIAFMGPSGSGKSALAKLLSI
jgi:ABC-type lipoprotein export system ATPase subunit